MFSVAENKVDYRGRSARLAAARKYRPIIKFLNKTLYTGSIAGIIVIVYIAYNSGSLSKWADSIADKFSGITADIGFVVQNINISGLKNLKEEELREVVNIKLGQTPIFGSKLNEMRENILKQHWVKDAVIERQLPSTISINIIEREPFAIWQNKGVLTLIDTEGTEIPVEDFSQFKELPLVVGENAYTHTAELFKILSIEPGILSKVKTLIWKGNRRWDVVLDNGIEIMLPENTKRGEAEEAWHRLADMQAESYILERNIKKIDLRIADRMFLTPIETKENKTQKASEEMQVQEKE